MSGDRDRERHERVLHTRVPESLEAELKERAAELGVSVSNLVRNVLNHAFGMVDNIVRDTEQIARSASGRKARPAPVDDADLVDDARPTVIGWQTLVLERNALCTKCNDILPRGTDAALAVVDGALAGPRPVLCLRCLQEVRDGSSHDR